MSWKAYPGLDERVYSKQLPNGLTLAVVPREGFQKKLAYFVTDYGSIHTDYRMDGEVFHAPAGVAHFLEHKLFDMPRGEVSAEFAALGANPNAFTSYDMTAYYFSCTENFEACLRLLLEFVSTPYFTDATVDKEQGIIGQEIDMTADSPESRIFENLMTAMYGCHPIRIPILGTRETIGKITPQVLTDCHRAFYNPANMMLCVVGDVDATEVERIALEMLGSEKPVCGQKLPLERETMVCHQKEIRQQMEVAMPMFQLGFKCEPEENGQPAARQEIVGDLAAEALFGESSSLYLELYEEGLIDSSFGGGFEDSEDMAMLFCSGDSDDPEAVRDAILERAAQLAVTGVEEADFLRMKRSALGRRIRDLDSFDATCFRVCASHLSKFDYFDFPEVYAEVTAEELREFLARVVRPERMAMAVIEPLEDEE